MFPACGDLRLECRKRVGHLLRAGAKALRRTVIDHGDDDVGEGLAVFTLKRGVRYASEKGETRQRAEPPTREPAPEGEHGRSECEDRHPDEQGNRQERVEDDLAGHCPNLSRRAGTWTWSDL